MALSKGADGFYHPKTEQEIIDLINKAREEKLQLRCRGAAHSVSCAIYTDPMSQVTDNRVNQETPPVTRCLNLMLDKFRAVEWVDDDPSKGLAWVEAGCNLGLDPFDPTHTSTWDNSMLKLMADHGWTVDNLGGIDHQAAGGFMSTGSSGGSITHSIHDNMMGMRIIGADGEPYEVFRDDKDPSAFFAAGVAMGLFGIVTKFLFQGVPVYNIVGQEASTVIEDASYQMFEVNEKDSRPSLEMFLREVEYTRLMWWPQPNIKQVVTWQAKRVEPFPGFRRKPYQEFSNWPNVGQPVCSIFFIVMGHYKDLSKAKPYLDLAFGKLKEGLNGFFSSYKWLKPFAGMLSSGLSAIIRVLLHSLVYVSKSLIEKYRPNAFKWFIDTFQGADSAKSGMSKDTPQTFQDIGWLGLPMDNAASDRLMPTEFTEIWIPVTRTQEVMCLLRDYFYALKSESGQTRSIEDMYWSTGDYAIELYGSKPNDFWMSMAHTNWDDEWQHGVIRLDIFWFEYNPGNPAEIFFPQFWQLLRKNNIPNRLHWGKYHPVITQDDPDGWVDFYRSMYPRWDDFLAMRKEKDPDGIFLTDYWRLQLGIEQDVLGCVT